LFMKQSSGVAVSVRFRLIQTSVIDVGPDKKSGLSPPFGKEVRKDQTLRV